MPSLKYLAFTSSFRVRVPDKMTRMMMIRPVAMIPTVNTSLGKWLRYVYIVSFSSLGSSSFYLTSFSLVRPVFCLTHMPSWKINLSNQYENRWSNKIEEFSVCTENFSQKEGFLSQCCVINLKHNWKIEKGSYSTTELTLLKPAIQTTLEPILYHISIPPSER